MKLLTWNVQWCRGVDGRVDPQRIVYTARDIADFDVLCLQEVAANFADPASPAAAAKTSSPTSLRCSPATTAIKGVAVDILAPDRPGRRRFGNLLLSRYPIRQAFRHCCRCRSMPASRACAGWRSRRTSARPSAMCACSPHLEYYGEKRRGAQVEALRSMYAEGVAYSRHRRSPAASARSSRRRCRRRR